MNFFLKRLTYRIKSNLPFLCVIACAPALIFTIAMAWVPSVHTISSSFAIPSETPMAKPGTPIGVVSLAPFMANDKAQKSFIDAHFNPFNIMDYPKVYGMTISPESIKNLYTQASRLSITTDNQKARVTYTGSDKTTGALLADYYSEALHNRIIEGYRRQGAHFTSPLMEKPQRDPSTPAQTVAWSWDRLIPSLLFLFFGAMVGLVFLIIREAKDTSYKSERQIAEHIRLPILGSLPNLNRVPVTAVAPQRRTP